MMPILQFAKYLIVLIAVFGLFTTTQSCSNLASSASSDNQEVREWATAYFEHYAKRTDWPGFLDHYAKDMDFHDPLLKVQLNNRDAFEAFYNWPDTAFHKHPDFPETMVVEKLVVEDSIAIGAGYFTPFYYQGVLYGENEKINFSMWLHFNAQGKIVQQTDWIQYPRSFWQ